MPTFIDNNPDLPEDAIFNSKEEAFEWIDKHYETNGKSVRNRSGQMFRTQQDFIYWIMPVKIRFKGRLICAARAWLQSGRSSSSDDWTAQVSAADQVAFKAEAAEIRKTLRGLKSDRWKREARGRTLSYEQSEELHRSILSIQDRLRQWRGILMVDGNRIRSPVRLWDAWNKLRNDTDYEAVELEYLSDGRLQRTYVEPTLAQARRMLEEKEAGR